MTDLAIIPQPTESVRAEGSFPLRPEAAIRVYAPGADEQAEWLGRRLSDALRHRFGRAPAVELTDADAPRPGTIHLAITAANNGHGDEGYELVIEPKQVVLRAGAQAGLFYGVQTLLQLVSTTKVGDQQRLPCCRVQDRPRFGWRGLMLDSCRHFQSVDQVMRLLDQMASLKLNRFHWHLTEDEAWRIQIDRYPRLTEVAAWRGGEGKRYGGLYTREDVSTIVAYAGRRGITVIPEIDMPGHCNAALVAYPELSCDGKPIEVADAGWDAYTRNAGRLPFCAGRAETYTFLENVLTELAELFDAPWIHIGGDERPQDVWSKCPRCRTMMAKHSLEDESALQRHFMDQIANHVHDRIGRRTIGWADNLDRGAPFGQTVQAWHPGQSALAARMGHDTINSNHEWVYLDYPWSQRAGRDKPDWMIVLPMEKVYHFDPMPEGLSPEQSRRVLGSEAPIWTEYVRNEAELYEQLMPRLVAFSETVWSPRDGRSFDGFRDRLSRLESYLRVDTAARRVAGTPSPIIKPVRVEPITPAFRESVRSPE